tara:strand:- start:5611 stop:8178 length:2568 start_codon:yes stop_codon:yes gene_type:complete
MPMGEGDGGGDSTASGFDPAAVAQASLQDLKNQEKKSEILKEIAASIGNSLEVAKQEIELDRIRLDAAKKYLKGLQKKEDFDLNAIANQSKIKEEFDKLVKATKLTTSQQGELNALQLTSVANIAQAVEKLEEFRSKQEISKDFAEDIASATTKLARNMGITADFSKTAAGKFAEMGQKFFSGDKAANTKAIMGAISGMVNPANILGSLIDIAAKKMLELNKAAVGLKVATGFANDFQSEMTAVAATTSKVGITLEASNAAFSSLTKGIAGINLESPAFRKNLGTSASLMTKLGVSADTTTKSFNLLLKTFKMSDIESTKLMESMASSASALGLTSEGMAQQFNSAMGYLSSFGKEGVKAFEDLAAQAGVSGIAIEKMLSMTKAFDKFGEGAKKAATLNSVLGTSLSTMALMAMNPAERMKELRNQINMATGGVNNMTQAQKLFTAEAMGYSSVAEMMADLQASPAQMAERAAAAKTQANIQERLANAMTELLPIADQLSMAFQALATNESLINALSILIDIAAHLVNNFEIYIGVLSVLSTAYAIATARAAMHTLATKSGVAANTLSVAGTAVLVAMRVKETTITTAAATAQMAYGRALMFSAGKVMLVVGLLTLLYMAFTKRGSPMLYMMPIFMAAGIFLMGKALDTMGLKAIVAALALAVLAGGIALVFYGIAAAVTAITGLFTTMSQSVETMPAVILGMFGLAAAFLFLGYAASFSSMGIFAGLAALTAMFLLFKLTGSSMADMFGAGDEILKIGTGIEKFGQGLNNIRSAVGELKGLIGEEGIFAGTIGGETSSIVMGQGTAVAKLFKNSKIEVDVKMPDITMPKVDVRVYIGNEELKTLINKEITRNQS